MQPFDKLRANACPGDMRERELRANACPGEMREAFPC
jgi:hypothetical protein